MTRTDIANYLRLASETVSRVFRRFQDEGSLRVDRRDIELSTAKLEELAQRHATALRDRDFPVAQLHSDLAQQP